MSNIYQEVLANSMQKRYIGGAEVKKIYVGSQLVFGEEQGVVITKPGDLVISGIGIGTEGDMD